MGISGELWEILVYFKSEIIRLHNENELSDLKMTDLIGFIKMIIAHITNRNKNEERLMNVMGGRVIETESERLMRQGMEQEMRQGETKMIVELGQEDGLSDEVILNRRQKKIGLSLEDAKAYLEQYGKQLA